MVKLRTMFDAYVTYHARLRPRAMALITPERWATYAELEDDVNRFAAGFRNLGVTPERGVVSLDIDNPYLKHVACLALARLGVVSSAAGDPGADLQLTDGKAEGPNRLTLTPAWIAARLEAEPLPVAPVHGPPDAVVRVMLSSGTTRTPRRVAQTWRSVEGNSRAATTTWLAGRAGRWVAVTGLDSMIGQNMAVSAWATGAALVAGLGVEVLAQDLETLQPAIIGMTPSHLRTLLRLMPAGGGYQTQLRVVVGGGVTPKLLAHECRLRLAPELWIAYGATECGTIAVGEAQALDAHAGATGHAVAGVRIEVVGPDGAPLPVGEQGEVRIFGERVAGGYLGDPEASAQVFRHGALYPGDLGRLMPDGLLVIDGRRDDRMNFGGMKFLPNLLEEAALSCPGVVDCACFAAPDADGIDHCWLAVVAGDGFDRERLADLVEPRGRPLPDVRFAWTAQIPRNAMGKIERQKLREETMAALGVSNPD